MRINKLIGALVLFASILIMRTEAYPQANLTNSGDVVCPATGTSIQIMPARSSRFSYLLNNINGVAVRIGYLDGTDTSALNSSNSWVLQPGQPFADSVPNVISKRIVCMSTTAASNTISFNEGYK